MIVKQIAVQFDQYKKIANVQAIPFDEILSQLLKKLGRDSEVIGPARFIFTDMSDITHRINSNETQIKNAFKILKIKQDELANFLVKFNNFKSEKVVDS